MGNSVILSDKIEGPGHGMPEKWLRARVRAWMNVEAQGNPFWIGSYTAEGKWIFCASRNDTYHPMAHLMKYAQDVCRFLNKESSAGGAWLAGWIGTTFYLLWKDPDGDIQIPIEAQKPWVVLQKYTHDDWLKHATAALGVWSEWKKNMEYANNQTVKLAQGQQPTMGHGSYVPPVAL